MHLKSQGIGCVFGMPWGSNIPVAWRLRTCLIGSRTYVDTRVSFAFLVHCDRKRGGLMMIAEGLMANEKGSWENGTLPYGNKIPSYSLAKSIGVACMTPPYFSY